MINSVYLNMPVEDVLRSKEFFISLGFTVNEQFSGPDNVCMVINPSTSLMLMNKEKFRTFIDKELAPKSTSEIILSFSCESENEVRTITQKALSIGARKINEPEDSEFMFSWAFEDLDGHLWDLFWMKQ